MTQSTPRITPCLVLLECINEVYAILIESVWAHASLGPPLATPLVLVVAIR